MSPMMRVLAVLAASGITSIMPHNQVLADDAKPDIWRMWDAWIELGGYAANHTDAKRGELTLWAPLMQDRNSLLFADVRGKLFAEDQQEGNFAIGYRQIGPDGWNPGFWVSFDRRLTASSSDFNQVSFGFEALAPDWDFRVNGYVPLEDRKLLSSVATGSGAPTVELSGGTILLVPGLVTLNDLYELAFWGVDAEVGFRIPLEHFDNGYGLDPGHSGGMPASRRTDLRFYLGGFYFDHKDFDGQIAGPRARAEWRIDNVIEDWEGSRLTFEAGYQYDEVRDNQFEVGARFRVPLGGETSGSKLALSPQEMRMSEGLKRDTDVVARSQMRTTTTSSGGTPEAVEDATTGVDFDSAVVVTNGSDLDAALTSSGQNALVIAQGGLTNFGAVTMQANQTLLGGGGSLQVRGRTSSTLATFTAPGSMPTIASSSGTVLTPANNAHIAGVVIDGNSASVGMLINSSQVVTVNNSTIQNTTVAVNFSAVFSSLTVEDSTIDTTSSSGINLGNGADTGIFKNTVFKDIGGSVIFSTAFGPANNLQIADSRFEGAIGGRFVWNNFGTTNLQSDSTNNVDATSFKGGNCFRTIFSTFTGSIDFTNTTSINQGNC